MHDELAQLQPHSRVGPCSWDAAKAAGGYSKDGAMMADDGDISGLLPAFCRPLL